MNKKVLVISSSPRKDGNSERLADEFIRGAKASENHVEKVTLRNLTMNFCKGCLACQSIKSGHCVQPDDADRIVQKMRMADVLVFATPIYFYEMCGQLKTLLDRTNPLFPMDYAFTDIYLLMSAADTNKRSMEGAIKGVQGWIDCFESAKLQGVVYGTGLDERDAVLESKGLLKEAYEMGLKV